eukprot:CAMPEP_0176425692 /NCGR_PEP_ID=MMETSP0127-20121128/11525_1 /TAXON_ID=938130 /ORGANISM="Platyophrya macrostoma, Strain WH" /LENGTH=184 /DNA_ID=CAMNT_0017806871 /DNA_START=37 /DNA_END=591 /DNA_ORIENTATION=+
MKTQEIDTKDSKSSQEPIALSREFVFSFSFFKQQGKQTVQRNYKDEIKTLGSFNTVEGFWSYYRHMVRPDKLPAGSEINVFQENIQPMWEDETNKNGGRFVMRIKTVYANRFWEELMMSFIGEQCEENDNICGLVLSIKPTDVQIAIWTKQIDEKAKAIIKEWLCKTLGLNDKVEIEYRPHPRK